MINLCDGDKVDSCDKMQRPSRNKYDFNTKLHHLHHSSHQHPTSKRIPTSFPASHSVTGCVDGHGDHDQTQCKDEGNSEGSMNRDCVLPNQIGCTFENQLIEQIHLPWSGGVSVRRLVWLPNCADYRADEKMIYDGVG
ncbi:unnamed protein product [Protopolystoma xenopodis]|uniref:Uncharacterized protein n=1 Tax=Protopolystoma xenopodis TaxID=117903 RepID=A0A448XMA6_9PLAT|nr:unnamed protein product [Protopolystoma xenopodis]